MRDRTLVVAVGGNSLIREGQRGTSDEQLTNAKVIARDLVALVEDGWSIVVTHGNGPQVGLGLLRSELGAADAGLPRTPLDVCVAASQGELGYLIAGALEEALALKGLDRQVACLLTRTTVDPNDAAFVRPTKPIGPFFEPERAEQYAVQFGWPVAEDAGRGHRRLVASPRPRRILEVTSIRTLLDAGVVVIAAGGGGIPVVEVVAGVHRGIEAVVDKDLASALLAVALEIRLLVLLTGVEKVALRYRSPTQTDLGWMTADLARQHLADHEFPSGSMGPKVSAALQFIERGGREAIITSPGHLQDAVAGRTGTHIVSQRTLA
jgi:carbamate kinase